MKEKKLITRKTRITKAVVAVVMIAIIGGSLAFWNQTHVVDNSFETGGKFGTIVIEEFTPKGDWLPGVEVNKGVQVINTGDQDVIVRVKMDEKWVRKDEIDPYKAFTAVPNKDVYKIDQVDGADGETEDDDSVVIKHFSNSSNWVDGGDGWFYYKTNLTKGKVTDKWLESVELIDDLDVGAQEVLYYVTTDKELSGETAWTLYDPEDGMPKVIGEEPVTHNKTATVYKEDANGEELIGYLNSNYTLTITTQTVQTSKEAVMSVFDITSDKLEELAVDWVFAD